MCLLGPQGLTACLYPSPGMNGETRGDENLSFLKSFQAKRKRDGRDQEERTLSCDLKLDDMLDRTLEDGAKQHNLTAVNVRNILHVSATGAVVYWEHREAKGNNSETLQSWYVNY